MPTYKYNTSKMRDLLYDYLKDHHPEIDLTTSFRCLSPEHEDKHPSMTFSPKYNICKCWACGKKYDIFSLVAQDYNISPTNFMAQVAKVAELYPSYIEINEEWLKEHPRILKKECPVIDFSNYFKKCQINISKTDYLQQRGIDERLVYKYGIGYDEKRNSIIFPINKNHYFARSTIDDGKFLSPGKISLWNEDKINSNNDFFIVTEAIIDALSLESIGCEIPIVSLNGTTHYEELIKKIKEENYEGTVILSLDNDHWGNFYGTLLKDKLQEINIKTIEYPFTHTYKDINEALVKDKNNLITSLNMLTQALTIKEQQKNENLEVSAKEKDSLEL